MKIDFDRVIDRCGKNCAKWDPCFVGEGISRKLPFWVADTDFRAPDAVITALDDCVRHGIFGYTLPPCGTAEAAANWQKSRHGFDVKPEWVSFISGVDCALSAAVQSFSNPGDQILINTPVYDPFIEAIQNNGREVTDSPLRLVNGKYEFDFVDFAEKSKQSKMWMFCNPQNPTSRCFTKQELLKLGELCARNNLIIVSDEIHADIVYYPYKHIPIASLSPELAARTITCTSPSKTFSVAGMAASVAIISDAALSESFSKSVKRNNINTGVLGLVAMQAAYESGADYAEQLRAYLQKTRDFLIAYLREKTPQITPIVPEATFLLWLDCSGLGLNPAQLAEFFDRAGVKLSNGAAYLEPSGQFYRFNFGCPLSIAKQGIDRIAAAALNTERR